MLPITLKDNESNVSASISNLGELIVAPLSPNSSVHHSMVIIDTPYIYAEPIASRTLRLQNILIYANKDVGPNDASVLIYTSDDATSLTGDTVIEFEMLKNTSRDLIGLNLTLQSGVYLLAKTNDNTVFLTMQGYYVRTV